MKIGWIGVGRMGAPMAARLLKAGYPVSIWNRTRAKAETPELQGATVVDSRHELADCDILFTMLSTGKDVADVCFGPDGMFRDGVGTMPKTLIDCSTIGMDEFAEIRARLDKLGVKFLAAPVSGNPKCVRAGKFCCVVSGPKDAYDAAKPLLLAIAPRGASYAGEGELARMCKIAVNLMLYVVNQNIAEVTLLAQQGGRAAPCLPRIPQWQRDRLDLHEVQGAGLRQSRLRHDVSTDRRSQGHGSRPRAGAAARGADAGHGGDARNGPGAYRREPAQAGRRGPGRPGFLGDLRDDGAVSPV